MPFSQTHYLPLTPTMFAALVVIFAALLILIELRVLRYAYMQLGVSSRTAVFLLFASLIGSYFNIPVATLPEKTIMSGRVVEYFGMRYIVPTTVEWPGTVIAVNIGGAVIPVLMSIFLLLKYGQWARTMIATAVVALVLHVLAHPVPGLGIAVPVVAPVLITAVMAVILSRQHSAQIAYVSGSIGTLLGADILNLDKISGLGAPIASIGGAGTFDGIFLTGILAVVFASIATWHVPRRSAY